MYKELFQTYLLSSVEKEEHEQIEYLTAMFQKETVAAIDSDDCFKSDWIESFEWFCKEAAGLCNLTEEQFYGLGQVACKCQRDNLVYVIWPDKKEISIWLNLATEASYSLREFSVPVLYQSGQPMIRIPFEKLSNFVDLC
jgi:hypothetical protein